MKYQNKDFDKFNEFEEKIDDNDFDYCFWRTLII